MLVSMAAIAEEVEGCSHFTWDVTHELAVMKLPATTVVAARSTDRNGPVIELEKLYEVQLAPQSEIRFGVKPAKPTLADSAQGGILRFRSTRGGVYRVSITSGHWIDIVDDGQLIRSKDFQGSRGCNRPHKIVAYELPANRDLLLQLSGGTESAVTLAVTFVEPDANLPRPWRSLTQIEQDEFERGFAVFNTEWVPAGSPPGRIDGLGPVFNLQSCDACHNSRRRGRGPEDSGEVPAGLVIQLARQRHGRVLRGTEDYGYVLNPAAIPGFRPEGRITVTYRLLLRALADGSQVELREPRYQVSELSGRPLPANTVLMPRLPPLAQGDGLLERVPLAELRRIARAEAGAPGEIRGEVSWTSKRQGGSVGRFGWQATEPTVASQIAAAFSREMGLTTPLIGVDDCGTSTDCRKAPSGGTPEVEPELFNAVVMFQRLQAVPVSNLFDEYAPGARLFEEVRCAACHRASLRIELESPQTTVIHPFTDLLVHSMGEGLADRDLRGRPVRSLWRTAPLWGMAAAYSSRRPVQLLHDGRARSLEEAILWHDGEGRDSRDRYARLTRDQRLTLLEWVRSL